MKDYSQGKIYKLYSVSNKDLIYYGSTIQKLNERLKEHISDYNNNRYCKSKLVIAAGDYKMELIENYPCNSKTELERKEGEYTKANKCVNKYIAGRTRKEYNEDNKEYIKEQKKEYSKEYYQNNKEKINEKNKKWREDNKEHNKEHNKEYREDNKEKIAERKKKWYKNNREKLKEQMKVYGKEKVTCECGCIIRRDTLIRHKKTNKHLELMK